MKTCATCGSKLVFAHLPDETKYQTFCDRVFRATLLKHMFGKRAVGEVVTHEEASALLDNSPTDRR